MRKRLFAVLLVCAVLVGLMPAAAAEGYPDVPAENYWAYEFITDMTERGLYQGYDDGLFHPERELTAAQAISICVRMCAFDEDIYAAAAADYREAATEAVAGEQSWFHDDFAVAVAAGITSIEELAGLQESGKLAAPLTREEFSPYLVRAMQLELPATSEITFDFGDTADISRAYRPTVYLLSSLGIVVGDTSRNFRPQSNIKREDSATMFSRAVDHIEKNGLIIELYDYEDYEVCAGTLASYDAGVLVVDNAAAGEVTVTLPDTAGVYVGNALADDSALAPGAYVRVCSNDAGIFAVRVEKGRATSYSGELVGFDGETVSIDTGTRTVELTLDRATLVSAGGKVGGVEVYDAAAEYPTVSATVDPLGRVAALSFEGGSRVESWFLTGISSTAGTISVESAAGEPKTFTLAEDAALDLPEGYTRLHSDFVGMRCELRVSYDGGEVLAFTPDTETEYLRGELVRTTITTYSRSITIKDVGGLSSSEVGYRLAAEAAVTIDGAAGDEDDLEPGMFVTMTVDADEYVIAVDAYDTARAVECVLEGVSYGRTITFDVSYADGTSEALSFEAEAMPEIKRGNRVITADKLRVGDTLTISYLHWQVTGISAAVVESDLAGVIDGISIVSSGTVVSIVTEDGETVEYPLAATAEILRDGAEVAVTTIQGMNAHISLVNDEIVTIEVSEAESATGQIDGTILFINSIDRTLLIERDDGSQVTVVVPYAAAVYTRSGAVTSFASLEPENMVTVYYEVASDGSYNATMVIVK